jgi:hypothetical protein
MLPSGFLCTYNQVDQLCYICDTKIIMLANSSGQCLTFSTNT